MGNIDTATRDYIRNKSVFADAFNFYVYGGEQVIKPEMLRQIDTAEIRIFEENENLKFLQRFRDGLNLCTMMQDENAAYLILGLEGQSEVHYAMPIKNMGYDYLRYNEQLESIAKKHRDERNEKYEENEEELENMQSSLREVLLFIKYSNDKLKLKKLVLENENYSRMDKKAARLLKVTTKFEIKGNIEDGKEEAVNMCKALVDLMEDAREEGRAEARDEMCKGLADMMEDAREEGRAEMQREMAEKQLEIARKLAIRGGFTLEEIVDLSGLDEETVKEMVWKFVG